MSTLKDNIEIFKDLNTDLGQVLYGNSKKKSHYDEFWDNFQQNGTGVVYYGYAFCNKELWTQEEIEKVKYKHLIANYFAVVFSGNTSITDLSMFTMESYKYSNGNHAALSFSACFSNCTNLVKCLPINFDFVSSAPNAFNGCAALEELYASGTIKFDGLNLKDSPKLSKASIRSIIDALSTTTNKLSITLSSAAVNKAFETEEGLLDGEFSEAWLNLKADKSNWTIYLA